MPSMPPRSETLLWRVEEDENQLWAIYDEYNFYVAEKIHSEEIAQEIVDAHNNQIEASAVVPHLDWRPQPTGGAFFEDPSDFDTGVNVAVSPGGLVSLGVKIGPVGSSLTMNSKTAQSIARQLVSAANLSETLDSK